MNNCSYKNTARSINLLIKIIIYCKVLKFSDARNFAVIHLKIKQRAKPVFCQKHANGIANSEDPDQTAPRRAVWSGSALFAQTYLSENLGSLRYIGTFINIIEQCIGNPLRWEWYC